MLLIIGNFIDIAHIMYLDSSSIIYYVHISVACLNYRFVKHCYLFVCTLTWLLPNNIT